MAPDAAAFLARFRAFGTAPSAESYLPLFHPDATLFDSGMSRPIRVPEIPEHIGAILALVPDFQMTPERWRLRDRTLFVEARNAASIGGRPARWRSVYCMDLAADRVVRGRRYYDRRPLFALLNPELPRLPLGDPEQAAQLADPEPVSDVAALVAAWGRALEKGEPDAIGSLLRQDAAWTSAGREGLLGRSAVAGDVGTLARVLPALEIEAMQWAGDETLAFLEWKARARIGGARIEFGGCDRLDLAAGLVLHGQRHFDTLVLATLLASAGPGAD